MLHNVKYVGIFFLIGGYKWDEELEDEVSELELRLFRECDDNSGLMVIPFSLDRAGELGFLRRVVWGGME